MTSSTSTSSLSLCRKSDMKLETDSYVMWPHRTMCLQSMIKTATHSPVKYNELLYPEVIIYIPCTDFRIQHQAIDSFSLFPWTSTCPQQENSIFSHFCLQKTTCTSYKYFMLQYIHKYSSPHKLKTGNMCFYSGEIQPTSNTWAIPIGILLLNGNNHCNLGPHCSGCTSCYKMQGLLYILVPNNN